MKAALFSILLSVSSVASAEQVKVQTMVSRQAALGITSDQLTTDTMYALEEQVLAKLREYAANKIPGLGGKRAIEEITGATSVLLEIGDQHLIITKIRVDRFKPYAQITGIKNDEFIRVLCLLDTDADIALVGNDCERVVEKTFGIEFPGGSISG